MRDSLWDIVRTPKAQRRLVIAAAAAPLMLLISYIFYFRGSAMLGVAGFWAVVMVVVGRLLSISVRRVTSLPNMYLDERQRQNRDGAYRIAYRGLLIGAGALWSLVFLAMVLWHTGPLMQLGDWIDRNTWHLSPSGRAVQNFWEWALQYLWLGLRNAGTAISGNILVAAIGLWAVWVTPLAVIAWNEAKRGGGVKRD